MKIGALTVLIGSILLGSDEPTEVGFDVLAGFDYEEGMELPQEVTKFHETKVKVNGFMRREDDGEGPTNRFMLINESCGCDGTPMLHEVVFCETSEDVEISANTVTVTGTLYVGEESEDGIVISIYELEAESIE